MCVFHARSCLVKYMLIYSNTDTASNNAKKAYIQRVYSRIRTYQ